jgi:hypothetical protein
MLDDEFRVIQVFRNVNFGNFIVRLKFAYTSCVKSKKPSDEKRYGDFKKIYQVWFQTLGLNPSLVKLSKEESLSLARYLYAIELMVECKGSAVRVSREVWEKIEDRMLRPTIAKSLTP